MNATIGQLRDFVPQEYLDTVRRSSFPEGMSSDYYDGLQAGYIHLSKLMVLNPSEVNVFVAAVIVLCEDKLRK